MQHGTRNTYLRHKCRCEPCVKAAQEYSREWYQKNAERRKMLAAKWAAANKDAERVIPDDKHGTVSGYEYWRCRCEQCRTAVREAKRQYGGYQPRPCDEDIPHGTRSKYRRGCRCEFCVTAKREQARQHYRKHRAVTYAKTRAWIKANQDRYRKWQANHYLANHEENKAKRREYERANRSAAIDRARLREVRIKGVWVEPVSRERVWERDAGLCHLCGLPADQTNWHLEHKIPVVLGGPHSYANVAVSHPTCNLRKGKRAYDGPSHGLCEGVP